jgi:hypothetical protein
VRAKVRHTDRTHIHVVPNSGQPLGTLMQRELVAPKVYVDPSTLFAVADLAAEYFGVEVYRGRKVSSGNR